MFFVLLLCQALPQIKNPINRNYLISTQVGRHINLYAIKAHLLHNYTHYYNSYTCIIHELVSQACLFTIVRISEHHEGKPDCSLSLPHYPSSLFDALPSINFPCVVYCGTHAYNISFQLVHMCITLITWLLNLVESFSKTLHHASRIFPSINTPSPSKPHHQLML